MFNLILFVLIISCCFCENYGANILFLNPVPSISHHLWNHRIAMALIDKGHNLTMVGADAKKLEQPKNYHPIVFEGLEEVMKSHDRLDLEATSDHSTLQMMQLFYEYVQMCVDFQVKSKGFKQLMDYPKDYKFDLIITDITAGPAFHPFIKRFNYPPTVGVTAFLLPTYVSHFYGNHLHPSYIPWYQTDFLSDMSFVQRVANFLLTYLDSLFRMNYEYGLFNDQVKDYFGEHMDDLKALERHINIVLSNTDPLLDLAQPLPPNIIPVGGLHARPSKPLPQDLKEVMEKSKDGVILFSLGTNVKSDNLKSAIKNSLLESFSKLKQTIIWKFESQLDNLPKNVIIRKWLPQNDILGHKNTVLFVNHGGALSTQEGMYHGKPMLCIPFFGDQHINSAKIETRKIGLRVDYSKITTEYLDGVFKEILNNPMYTKNSQDLARQYRDQPQTPLQRAVFWIEHALRNNGSSFLNTKARDLPMFVAESADVILFITSVIVVIIYLFYKFVGFLVNLLRKPTEKTKLKTK